jgi:hypothetical protein
MLSLGLYYLLLALDMVVRRQGEVKSGYIDEIFLVFLGLFAVPGLFRLNNSLRLVLGLYGLFTLLSLASAAFNGLERFDPAYPRWLAASIAVLLDAKTFVAMLAFVWVIPRLRSEAPLRAVFMILIGIAVLNTPFLLRDLLVGGSNLYGEPLAVRDGYVRPQGFLAFVVDSADLTLIAALAAAALYIGSRRWIWAALWIALSLLTPLHFSVKESIAVMVCTAILAMAIPFRHARVRLYIRTFFIGIAAVAAFPLAQYVIPVVSGRVADYIGGDLSDTVRSFTYVVSSRIAGDFFPLGSGAGTFASLPSRDFYFSPLYDIYGPSHMHGAARHFSGYLMDTFWPKVLAESGWFGLAVYLAMFCFILWRAAANLAQRADGLNVFCLCVLATAAVKSFAASIMTQETFVVLLGFVIAYVLLHPIARGAGSRARTGIDAST